MQSLQDIEAYKKLLENNPRFENQVVFESDVWDFSTVFDIYKPSAHKCSFEGLPEDLANGCKFYILQRILLRRQKLQTIISRYTYFRIIYNNIVRQNPSKRIQTITAEDIISEVQRRDLKDASAYSIYESVYQVCYFLQNTCDIVLSIDLHSIDAQKKVHKSAKTNADAKLPNIPEEYFNLILNKAIEVMRADCEAVNMRMIAAALVLLTQTGLRISEILALTTDRLKTKTLPNINVETQYLHYISLKPSRPGEPLLEFDISCTSVAAEAFNIMKKLRNDIKAENKKNTLFVLSGLKKNTLPYGNDLFARHYYRFMYTYLYAECTKEWKGIAPRKGSIIYKPETLYVPDTRQYRVHFCTTLYQNNVDLRYIQKYMGHLSDSMLGYYSRPKDNHQENVEYTGKVLTEMVEEDLTPLGGRLIGDKLKEEIQKFVAENNFDVRENVYQVIDALGERLVIRGKRGGVCIKTILESCKDDAHTDKLMCAHSLCPNLFHFYYMLDITYVDFQTMQENYFYMKKESLKRACEKELGKIKDLIKRRLLPELDELEKELEKKGYNAIV